MGSRNLKGDVGLDKDYVHTHYSFLKYQNKFLSSKRKILTMSTCPGSGHLSTVVSKGLDLP